MEYYIIEYTIKEDQDYEYIPVIRKRCGSLKEVADLMKEMFNIYELTKDGYEKWMREQLRYNSNICIFKDFDTSTNYYLNEIEGWE